MAYSKTVPLTWTELLKLLSALFSQVVHLPTISLLVSQVDFSELFEITRS
jgi:hypothetical protein